MQEVQLFIKDINNVEEVETVITNDVNSWGGISASSALIVDSDLFSSGIQTPSIGQSIIINTIEGELTGVIYNITESSGAIFVNTTNSVSINGAYSYQYIITSKENIPKFKRVDLFSDETISLTQSIQNVKDIAKVFTDFTKTFTLPANPEVNKLFKHYYNFDIVGGFDARLKVDALIKLNGVDFKEGKIKLEGVDLKDNKPQSYRVTFFGKLVELKDLIGDDKLDDLEWLDNFSEEYSQVKVNTRLQTSLNVTVGSDTYLDAILAPLISADNRLYYDSSENIADSNNLHFTDGTSKGLDWKDTKYAIKVLIILKAIEQKYGFTFSSDFLHENNSLLDNFYLWMHRKKGRVTTTPEGVDVFTTVVNGGTNTQLFTDSNNFNLSYNTNGTFTQDRIIEGISFTNIQQMSYFLTITPSDLTKTYSLITKRDGAIVNKTSGLTGVTTNLSASDLTFFAGDADITFELQAEEAIIFTSVEVECKIGYYDFILNQNTFLDTASVTLSNIQIIEILDFIPTQQVPEIKVLDFLTGLFKMFNLTSFFNGTEIVVKPLNNFYNAGNTIDITDYVDVNTSSVNLALPYNEVDFRFEGNESFLSANYNQLNNKEFSQVKYKGETPNNWVGNSYKVEIPFEKMMYERLYDLANADNITLQYGLMVDDNQEPHIDKPLLFFSEKVIFAAGANISMKSLDASYDSLGRAFIPSNQVTLDDNTSQSINFYAEFNEYTATTNNSTLFRTYYEDYVSDVFNEKRRLSKIKAFLPLKILLTYTLADVFVINGKKYKINSITSNLQTGESDLELLNEV